MLLRDEYLIKLNAKNRIQKVKVELDFHPIQKIYSIYRTTGQYGGKETDQPVIEIQYGKAGRTLNEQAGLQYAHILTEYMNSGYKKLSSFTNKKFDELSEEELKSLLSSGGNTDTKGVPKPMLAKSSDDLSGDIFEKDVYVSRKINGVRCLMYYKDGMILTASRGGLHYNESTTHLRNDPMLLKLFQTDPELILDGELYKHGWPLQKISGICRSKEHKPECDQIEYWVYDFISTMPFKKRVEILEAMEPLFDDTSKIKILKHNLISGWLKIKKEHDKYVQEGFEGLCARTPNKEYGVGKRSGLYMWKLKEYKDAEAEIIDVKEGLRQEDMSFVLCMPNGKTFSAKPMGDADTRREYLLNKDKYIGLQMTYSYFDLSTDGIPTQPVAMHIRPNDE